MKKTMVLGASPNADRYSYKAVKSLTARGYDAVPVGIREGKIGDLDILLPFPPSQDIHTITLYLGPEAQVEYYDYILGLKPQRIIFNPGTENPLFYQKIKDSGLDIEIEIACTLVLLSTNTY